MTNMHCYLITTLILLFVTLRETVAFEFDIKLGGDKLARFDRFDGTCGGRKDMVIILNFDSYKVENKKLIMNGTFTVKKDIFYPPSVNIFRNNKRLIN